MERYNVEVTYLPLITVSVHCYTTMEKLLCTYCQIPQLSQVFGKGEKFEVIFGIFQNTKEHWKPNHAEKPNYAKIRCLRI